MASGSGSNFQSVIDGVGAGDLPLDLALLLSNKADAYALKRARAANIGLAPGDMIVGVNGNEVKNVKELNNELTDSVERSSVVLSVERGRFIYSLTFPMST